jgi:hypothetical protein
MALSIQEFNSAFAKSVKQYFDNQSWESVMNSAYAMIYDVSDTTEYDTSYISTEGSDLPQYFDEAEPLVRSTIGKGHRVAYSKAEFGKIMSITKKARLKVPDTTEAILKIANSQKDSAIISMNNFLERQMWALLDYANGSNAAYSILAPDGFALYSDTHTWNSTNATFDNNLGTAALTLATAAAVEAYGGAFVDANGNAMPQNFNKIFVKKGGTASRQAKTLYSNTNAQGQYETTTLGDINIYAGSVQVIEIPWMSSGNDYVFVADAEVNGVDNPLFCEFVQRPMAEEVFKENDNLNRDMPYSASFAFGIKNMPFNILGGKVA